MSAGNLREAKRADLILKGNVGHYPVVLMIASKQTEMN